jgi:hypothetical protein
MGYLVEQYRKNDEYLMQKLHEAKTLLCEVMEELENAEDLEMNERRNYRINRKSNYRGRFDY